MSAVDIIKDAGIVVVKIGSVLVTDKEKGTVKQDWIDAFTQDVHKLIQKNKRIVIVSSGAVALGRNAVGIPANTPPSSIALEQKQAASAVGQFHLFNSYYQAFNVHDITIAQVLLTMSETENRRMHLNARETLMTLLDKGIVPIINENDTVSTGEIRFGDNDRLAARVAQMIDADAVILLSTTDGLYSDNPDSNPDAEHIAVIDKITDEHTAMAGEAIAGLSTGGMKSKVEAARTATQAGIPLIITDGEELHSMQALVEDENKRSSTFLAQETRSNARKKWIQAHLKPKGAIIVDEGAQEALVNGKSLLPIGVLKIEGTFERGDAVMVFNEAGNRLAIGLSAYSSVDAQRLTGKQSAEIESILGYAGREELVHRNDMVLAD